MRLTGEVVTIELKNGATITGTVVGVDQMMNIHLKVVKFVAKGKNPVTLDQSTVRGNTIRNVILPESLNLDTLLVDDTPKVKVKAQVKGLRSFVLPWSMLTRSGVEEAKKRKGKGPETKQMTRLIVTHVFGVFGRQTNEQNESL